MAPVRTVEHRGSVRDRPALEIVRSRRRRRSASAYARDGTVVVQLPAGLEPTEEERLIGRLVDRVTGAERARRAGGDQQLRARADELADRWLGGTRAHTVSWSQRMRRRYGSCTPSTGTIRISREVAAMPEYVRDYILLHELAHLQVADHSPAFWALVDQYPEAGRARGFLEGLAFGGARPARGEVDDGAQECSAGPVGV